jgi:hypothetical protein
MCPSRCPGTAVCATTLREGRGFEAFSCRRPDDECLGDADCGLFGRCDKSSRRRGCLRERPAIEAARARPLPLGDAGRVLAPERKTDFPW